MAYCYGSYISTGCGKANVTKGCSGDLRHRRTLERVEEDRESGLWESETNMISHETFFSPHAEYEYPVNVRVRSPHFLSLCHLKSMEGTQDQCV